MLDRFQSLREVLLGRNSYVANVNATVCLARGVVTVMCKVRDLIKATQQNAIK